MDFLSGNKIIMLPTSTGGFYFASDGREGDDNS